MNNTRKKTVKRNSHLATIKVGDIRVDSSSQREATRQSVHALASNFNPDLMGIIVVSHRDGVYWVMDGQHRILALKEALGEDADDWEVVAECYEGLTEEQEADMFLDLNNRRTVSAFDKYKVGVTARRHVPEDIERIVTAHGLRTSKDGKPGSISAVTALQKVYEIGGYQLLSRTLSVISAAWDATVWDSFIIRGVARFLNHFQQRVDDERLIKILAAYPMANKGLKMSAEKNRKAYGVNLEDGTAVAITEAYNKGRRGANSLGNWFKVDE